MGEVAALEVDENLLAGHRIGGRRLEHPLTHRLDDLHRASKRDQRNVGVLEHRHHCQSRAGRAGTDNGNDLVLLNQPSGEGARTIGVGGIVVDDQLQFLAVHTAFRVDLIDIDFQGPLFRIAEKGCRSGHRQDGANLDLRGGLQPGAEHGAKANYCSYR